MKVTKTSILLQLLERYIKKHYGNKCSDIDYNLGCSCITCSFWGMYDTINEKSE